MKYYIFLTADIHPIGGMQTYVAGKAAWLEKTGWTVKMFFNGASIGECAIKSLNKYLSGGVWKLNTQPGIWTKFVRSKILNKMSDQICCDWKNTEIIIESQADTLCLWGELLAMRLHAKHICFVCNERFRGLYTCYENYFDFFDFKHKRKELACICETAICNLFKGYKDVKPEERYNFIAAPERPIQDVKSDEVAQLCKSDWNICHIGRSEKPYVPRMINDIARFAKKYPNKKIQFIIVGNIDSIKGLLEEKIYPVKNIKVSAMGDMVPIPRSLFSIIDVVIGTSGCAYYAAREDVPTIIADAGNEMANGIYGYTTFDNIFHEKDNVQTDYVTALEQVLIEKVYENIEFSLPEIPPASYHYKNHFEFIKQSEKKTEYYGRVIDSVTTDYKESLKVCLKEYFPLGLFICQKIKGCFRIRKTHRN